MNIPILRSWANSVESHALKKALDGEPVEGFKLVRGRANRIWREPGKAQDQLVKSGLTLDEVAPRSLVSPPTVEKLLKKKKMLQKWGRIAKLILRPEGRLSLVPEDDPRPEAQRGSEFKDQPLDTDED